MKQLIPLLACALLLPGTAAFADRTLSTACTISDVAEPLVLGATGLFWASEAMSARPHQGEARRTAEAVLYTIAATHLVKTLVNQPRPCAPEAKEGFPSGHTAISFAFAQSLAERNNNLTIPAYLFASAVAWSRVKRKAHTTPQVVAGAALGMFVAAEVWER